MNSACPKCKTLVKLEGFIQRKHSYIVDGKDYSEITFEGRCKRCRIGVIYSYYAFCDKIISWTNIFELNSISSGWIEMSKKYKNCLYLYRKEDYTVVDLIHEFKRKNKKDVFYVTKESDFDSIRACKLSFLPVIVFPDSFFEFSDSNLIPSIFAERILSSFVKAPFCISDTYLNNFSRFEL